MLHMKTRMRYPHVSASPSVPFLRLCICLGLFVSVPSVYVLIPLHPRGETASCLVYLYTNISEVGGSETNREIVSVRSHACMHARSGSEVGIGTREARPAPFLFSLLAGRVSSSEFGAIPVSSSEFE